MPGYSFGLVSRASADFSNPRLEVKHNAFGVRPFACADEGDEEHGCDAWDDGRGDDDRRKGDAVGDLSNKIGGEQRAQPGAGAAQTHDGRYRAGMEHVGGQGEEHGAAARVCEAGIREEE